MAKRTGLQVFFEDERLTTKEADEILEQTEVPRGERKAVIDQLAAVLILESYLAYRKNASSGQADPAAQ